jgi:hypothetical protein
MMGTYSISPAEVSIVFGVIAIVGLAYVIGLKIFELLPVEAKESECELCGARFKSMDECCEHAEKEHQIAKASCDMCCKEV